MLRAEKVVNYENVRFEQDQERPYILNIVQLDAWNYETLIGRFNFYTKDGFLLLLNGKRKEYTRFQPLMNNFFKYNEMFGWNFQVVENAKAAGKEMIKAEKNATEEGQKEAMTEKAMDYLNKVINGDEIVIKSLQSFKDKTDEELMNIIANSFKGLVTKQLEKDVFNAIKEVLSPAAEVVVSVEETQETTKFIAYNRTFSTFVEAYEYCKTNDLDYLYIREVTANQEGMTIRDYTTEDTQTSKTSYIVANKKFKTYTEAKTYCIESDFDPNLMIEIMIEEVNASSHPSEDSENITEETNEPVKYYYYNQTFDTYMDAYNYAIKNMSPVTMVLASNHPTMTNERLMELEREYVFNKRKMAYEDMKEYFAYISELPVSLDQEERYYKLRDMIKRYEYQEQQRQNRESEQRKKAMDIDTMLKGLYELGMDKKEYKDMVVYYMNGEKVYSWMSGISTDKMHSELVVVCEKLGVMVH